MKAKIGDSFAIFDENSNKLFTIKANDINKFYNTEYFIVKTNTGYYTVNKKGERIENTEFLKYEQPKFVPSEYKKYIIISNSDSKKGMVNEKGIIFIKPIYDDFYFSFPLILLKKDNKLGYYNVKTKEFSDCKYDGVSRFQGNKRHNNWIFYLNGIKTEVKN